jgi:hypothetical protein
MHVTQALGALQAKLEEAAERAEREEPTTAKARWYPFVRHPELRAILERDDLEITRSFSVGNWKATIVLAGGAIEAILLDRLLSDEPRAKAAKAAAAASSAT